MNNAIARDGDGERIRRARGVAGYFLRSNHNLRGPVMCGRRSIDWFALIVSLEGRFFKLIKRIKVKAEKVVSLTGGTSTPSRGFEMAILEYPLDPTSASLQDLTYFFSCTRKD